MADHAVVDDFDGDSCFIYRGGRAPQHTTHVLIDKSIDEIEEKAFQYRRSLTQVDTTHNGLRKIGDQAFWCCTSLRRINLKSAVEIDEHAFYKCENLESVEFGDRLETIRKGAFSECSSLKYLQLPSIITIGAAAFQTCVGIVDVELSEQLETIEGSAFRNCERLQRIAIPLKRDLFSLSVAYHVYNQFEDCEHLSTVDIVGGIQKTIASLHMERWRTDMIAELSRINQVLPKTHADEKTVEIQQWMEVVLDKMDHYKAEHFRYVDESATILELALWKAKLGEKEDDCEEHKSK